MAETTSTLNHGGQPKPGDQVRVMHDCWTGLPDGGLRHEALIYIHAIDQTIRGPRARGVRCDGSGIEWFLDEEGRTDG